MTWIVVGRRTGTEKWRWFATAHGAIQLDPATAQVFRTQEAAGARAVVLTAENKAYEFRAKERKGEEQTDG